MAAATDAVVLTSEQAVRLSRYVAAGEFDDGGDAALHRPGSWEWQLEHAAEARGVLKAAGYAPEPDPSSKLGAPSDYFASNDNCTRVRWVRVADQVSAAALAHAAALDDAVGRFEDIEAERRAMLAEYGDDLRDATERDDDPDEDRSPDSDREVDRG